MTEVNNFVNTSQAHLFKFYDVTEKNNRMT